MVSQGDNLTMYSSKHSP